jgi:hypothetical protein
MAVLLTQKVETGSIFYWVVSLTGIRTMEIRLVLLGTTLRPMVA